MFQLSTLRNDPSVSHKKRLPGRATILALHQSLSQPPRALGASMTGSARCWGRADRRGCSELRVRYFCFRRPRYQLEGKGVYEGAADRMPLAIPEHSTAEAGSAGTWPWTPVRGLFSVARSGRI